MSYRLDLDFTVTGHLTTEQLEEVLDHVLEFLYDDARVIDPDYAASLATGEVCYSMDIRLDDEIEANLLGLSAIRAAIHGAGGCTPEWEVHFEKLRMASRRAELADA